MSRVSETVYEQMGARKFAIMTGANNFMASDKALSFKIPGGGGFAKDGINYVTVTLAANDTYTMEFFRTRGAKIKQILRYCDVHWDQLQEIFTRATGLATSLETIGRKLA